MPSVVNYLLIPWFDQDADNSFVPTKVRKAIARSGGPERLSGRRVSASLWTAASTMARLNSLTTKLGCVVMLMTSSALWSCTARAERLSPPLRAVRQLKVDPYAEFVVEASNRFGIPQHWIRAVIRIESAGALRARSQKGAMGLMQIMPATWRELRIRYGLGADPYDPHDNVLAGAAYLREMHDRYGTGGFLAAYNAGPGRYERHLATGEPLPFETQSYVQALAPIVAGDEPHRSLVVITKPSMWSVASVFPMRNISIPTVSRLSSGEQKGNSPSVRSAVDLSALVPQSTNLFVRISGQGRSQ